MIILSCWFLSIEGFERGEDTESKFESKEVDDVEAVMAGELDGAVGVIVGEAEVATEGAGGGGGTGAGGIVEVSLSEGTDVWQKVNLLI
jgi:hypothetical protein